MNFTILAEGPFELFRTVESERILTLNDLYFRLLASPTTGKELPNGELQAIAASTVDRDIRIERGAFRLANLHPPGRNQGRNYLYLHAKQGFEEIFLPRGIPDTPGESTAYLFTGHQIPADHLMEYLRKNRDGHSDQDFFADRDRPPFDDYFDLTAGDLADRIREMEPAELRELEAFEVRHKNRPTVLNTIRNQFRQ